MRAAFTLVIERTDSDMDIQLVEEESQQHQMDDARSETGEMATTAQILVAVCAPTRLDCPPASLQRVASAHPLTMNRVPFSWTGG